MMYFLLCAERCLLRCREAKIHDAICLFDEAGGSCNCCALTSFCYPSAGMHGLRITDLSSGETGFTQNNSHLRCPSTKTVLGVSCCCLKPRPIPAACHRPSLHVLGVPESFTDTCSISLAQYSAAGSLSTCSQKASGLCREPV